MKKIGFIDHYLDEFHALNYPAWIAEASDGEAKVCYAYAETDKPGGKGNLQYCGEQDIELLNSIEEVVEKSDYLIVLSPDYPHRHKELCRIPLASGKPTYIDKIFAQNSREALEIIHMAKVGNTPFFSSSALRFAEEYADISPEGIDTISSHGPGTFEIYAIHQLEPIVALMGIEVEKIMYFGTPSTPSFLMKFSGGRCATMTLFDWKCDFSMAIGYRDDKTVVTHGATRFFERFINVMLEFFKTGIPAVDTKETLRLMTILEYGEKAIQMPDKWLEIPKLTI